ncbi:MAG: tRNA (adenosine(37)-N6)-threonylcarbamoyltransferase complex transferase subunit TsaD [Candidatus Nealsonbacteria bacterium]|nr:MAG: tRNA (adenosine(37)-N6)-threonylcarbamoyltransferase complex transferase subunit TsaD [Candidatus Nealsonbacteria bacterium]
MRILGIDTSCDDTAVALLKVGNSKFEILSNIVSSQVKIHQKYGGVYPFLAKREHQKNLPIVLKSAIKGYKFSNIDLIGVTVGPGLEPCLWQGINFAKEIARKHKKPLIPVNHIEAHILANFINRSSTAIKFPAVALVVSGGHTQLVLIKKIGQYKLIGETRDDAAGECFDKVARILDLGYPGGPAIAAQAAKFKKDKNYTGVELLYSLPRPMIKQKNYDFSFSGLKTAVLYKVKEKKYNKKAMAAEVQQAIIDVLIYKTLKAVKDYKVKSVLLGGGVAANDELRKQFRKKTKIFVPPKNLCTDNAAMVAATCYFHRKERKKLEGIKADANFRIKNL